MKIAVVTDDGKTISAHFGRARYFLVATVENSKIDDQEVRPKANHHDFAQDPSSGAGHDEHHSLGDSHEHGEGHGHGAGAQDRHARMFAAISDCDVVLARGMGTGAYVGLQEAGIRPVVTTVVAIDEALRAYIAGELKDHPEKLH